MIKYETPNIDPPDRHLDLNAYARDKKIHAHCKKFKAIFVDLDRMKEVADMVDNESDDSIIQIQRDLDEIKWLINFIDFQKKHFHNRYDQLIDRLNSNIKELPKDMQDKLFQDFMNVIYTKS